MTRPEPQASTPLTGVWALCAQLDRVANTATHASEPRPREEKP